jgi:predicted Zn-dependent protease
MTEPKYKINEIVYVMIEYDDEGVSTANLAYIAKGRVTGIIQLNENGYKYIVSGHNFSVSRYDSYVYATIEELIEDFRSVIIQ